MMVLQMDRILPLELDWVSTASVFFPTGRWSSSAGIYPCSRAARLTKETNPMGYVNRLMAGRVDEA